MVTRLAGDQPHVNPPKPHYPGWRIAGLGIACTRITVDWCRCAAATVDAGRDYGRVGGNAAQKCSPQPSSQAGREAGYRVTLPWTRLGVCAVPTTSASQAMPSAKAAATSVG